jgi:hypothetical protein
METQARDRKYKELPMPRPYLARFRSLMWSTATLGIAVFGVYFFAEKSLAAKHTFRKPLRVIKPKLKPLPPSKELRKRQRLFAPSGVWTWFDIPGTKCGYGSTTGMAINPSQQANSKTLLLFLQGGGACWREKGAFGGCFGFPRTAFSLSGFNRHSFRTNFRMRRIVKSFVMQRNNKNNPFRKAHFALLPYCTGDVHSGNAIVTFRKGRTIHFHGCANMQEYLKRLVPTFHNVKHVVLAGVSAGGFGATLNWQRVKRAFGPKVRVDLLNDAGALIDPPAARWKRWSSLWNIQLPKGCQNCKAKGIQSLLSYYHSTLMKQGKLAFVGHTADRVIRSFLGLGLIGKRYPRHLKRMLKRFDRLPRANYFILKGGNHGMLIRRHADQLKGKNGQALGKWLAAFIKNKPTWKSTHPFPPPLRVVVPATPKKK